MSMVSAISPSLVRNIERLVFAHSGGKSLLGFSNVHEDARWWFATV